MRISYLLPLLGLAVSAVKAVKTEQQSILVSYPDDTPQAEIDKAMDVVREAGGFISHEYKLIKGFAASASVAAIESIKVLSDTYLPLIEEDSIVSIDGSVPDAGKV